jgi:energy-coupling factor transporter ATP-binding protein EcfA2
MVHLIGLSGKRGSGKDTFARLLQQLQPERSWQIRSFGDAIKSVCAALAAEDVAPYYTQQGKAQVLPAFGRTRGEMLQQVGQALRMWEPQVWISAFVAQIERLNFVIVPDVRFPEEADLIRRRGGIMLRLEGDPLRQRGDGTRDDNHPSEISLDHYQHFAGIIHNSGSRQDLEQQIWALLGRL